MRQCVAGTSVTRSTPRTMLRQNAWMSTAPGKRPPTPTIAMGGLGSFNVMSKLHANGREGEGGVGDGDAVRAKLLGARDDRRALEEVQADLPHAAVLERLEVVPARP